MKSIEWYVVKIYIGYKNAYQFIVRSQAEILKGQLSIWCQLCLGFIFVPNESANFAQRELMWHEIYYSHLIELSTKIIK